MKNLCHIRFKIPDIGETSPVVIIGTGGIVEDAHLPAYKLAAIPVAGIFDIDKTKAEKVAGSFKFHGYMRVYNSVLRKTNAIVFTT